MKYKELHLFLGTWNAVIYDNYFSHGEGNLTFICRVCHEEIDMQVRDINLTWKCGTAFHHVTGLLAQKLTELIMREPISCTECGNISKIPSCELHRIIVDVDSKFTVLLRNQKIPEPILDPDESAENQTTA